MQRQPEPWMQFASDPTRCPHNNGWEFMGTEFKDGHHSHTIDQVFRCSECGLIHRVPRDVRRAGRLGSIDILDPRVVGRVLLNESFLRVVGGFEGLPG